MKWSYQYEVMSVCGVIQLLAENYLPATGRYWFYVATTRPPLKDPAGTDKKLTQEKYQLADIPPWENSRREKAKAKVQYLRYKRWTWLIATKGIHRFYDRDTDIGEGGIYDPKTETGRIFDVRRTPLKFKGFSLTFDKSTQKAVVRIERKKYRGIKKLYFKNATRWSGKKFRKRFRYLQSHYNAWDEVQEQLDRIRKAVNVKRRSQHLPLLPPDVIRKKRLRCHPYEKPEPRQHAA